ncbi:MAG: ArnT family glycosyltransferase [Planctomycetota bacterium]|jgi:4-amino-4-deoxy-L-arabinose transferase-like glycosyltransferase
MGLSDKGRDKKNISVIVLFITLLIIGIYMFMNTCSSLWDRDEPQYAQVAMEMVESGDYLVPTIDSQMWLGKPPLLYWLMSVSFRIFGPTEFSCRFFSAIGTGITCLLTYIIGRTLLSKEAGLWTMPILASTILVLVIGTAGITDALMLPFIVAVMAVLVKSAKTGMRFIHIVLMGSALGFGILTKGPIGLMPIPAIATMLWFDRKNRSNTLQYIWRISLAIAIGAAFFIAWAIPVNIATKGEFFRVFVGRDIINRAFTPMESHGGNFVLFLPYYLYIILGGFFPWTLYLPGAFSALLGGRVGGKYGRVLLLSWIVPCFILMTIAATKLPHYVLFIWPALSLAVAGTIAAQKNNQLTSRDKIWLQRGAWIFVPFALVMSLGLIVGPFFVQVPGLRWSGVVSGLLLLTMSIVAVYYHRADKLSRSASVMIVGMIVFHIPLLLGVLPAIERIKVSPYIARDLNSLIKKDVPVVTYKYDEPSLSFYLGRLTQRLETDQDVLEWVKQPQDGVLVVPEKYLNRLQQEHESLPLKIIASKEGFNYSKGKKLNLLVLARRTEKQ